MVQQKTYAQWIGEELNCRIADIGEVTIAELEQYDAIIYGETFRQK